MKNFLHILSLIGMVILICIVLGNQDAEQTPSREKLDVQPSLNIDLLPAGDNIAFASTLCRTDIEAAKQDGFHTIIRLNGDTPRDVGCLTIAEESALCAEMDIDFYYFNIEGNITKAYAEISKLLRDGNTLVHCRNGAHRAPGAMAYHLGRQGIERDKIVETVGWETLVKAPGPYARYVEAALNVYRN